GSPAVAWGVGGRPVRAFSPPRPAHDAPQAGAPAASDRHGSESRAGGRGPEAAALLDTVPCSPHRAEVAAPGHWQAPGARSNSRRSLRFSERRESPGQGPPPPPAPPPLPGGGWGGGSPPPGAGPPRPP